MKQLAHYHPGDVAGASRTVGRHLSRGFSLVEIWCLPCHRMQQAAVHDLPPDLEIAQVWRRYRCSECGGQDLASQVSMSEMVAFWDAGMLDGHTPL